MNTKLLEILKLIGSINSETGAEYEFAPVLAGIIQNLGSYSIFNDLEMKLEKVDPNSPQGIYKQLMLRNAGGNVIIGNNSDYAKNGYISPVYNKAELTNRIFTWNDDYAIIPFTVTLTQATSLGSLADIKQLTARTLLNAMQEYKNGKMLAAFNAIGYGENFKPKEIQTIVNDIKNYKTKAANAKTGAEIGLNIIEFISEAIRITKQKRTKIDNQKKSTDFVGYIDSSWQSFINLANANITFSIDPISEYISTFMINGVKFNVIDNFIIDAGAYMLISAQSAVALPIAAINVSGPKNIGDSEDLSSKIYFRELLSPIIISDRAAVSLGLPGRAELTSTSKSSTDMTVKIELGDVDTFKNIFEDGERTVLISFIKIEDNSILKQWIINGLGNTPDANLRGGPGDALAEIVSWDGISDSIELSEITGLTANTTYKIQLTNVKRKISYMLAGVAKQSRNFEIQYLPVSLDTPASDPQPNNDEIQKDLNQEPNNDEIQKDLNDKQEN